MDPQHQSKALDITVIYFFMYNSQYCSHWFFPHFTAHTLLKKLPAPYFVLIIIFPIMCVAHLQYSIHTPEIKTGHYQLLTDISFL